MDRRTLLRQTGAIALIALAGCTSNPGGDSPDESATPDDGTDASETPTDGSGDADGNGDVPAGATFEVTDVASGTQVDSAAVAFDGDAGTVRVDGTIWGADGCKTAVLDSVARDDASGQVTVSIATTDREGTADRACTQAIVEITYEAVVPVEGELPASVTVRHDGRVVTETSRQ